NWGRVPTLFPYKLSQKTDQVGSKMRGGWFLPQRHRDSQRKAMKKKGGNAHLHFTPNEDIGAKDFFEMACNETGVGPSELAASGSTRA
ncbi:MAG: hypothetical protein ACQEQN_12180, partial [Thermodesulfobacteriota bacterium]